MTYWSGVVDENDLCFLGGTPHGLMDVFGLRSTELDALYDQDVNAGVGEGKTYEIRNFCDLVKRTVPKRCWHTVTISMRDIRH